MSDTRDVKIVYKGKRKGLTCVIHCLAVSTQVVASYLSFLWPLVQSL